MTTLLYVLVAAAAVSVVPWEQLAESKGPLAAVANTASPALGQAVGVVALFATANTVLLILATGPRVMYGMARRRLLPGLFGAVWDARGTPWLSILVALAVSVAFALTGKIDFVARVTNVAVFTLFAVVNTALIRLRMTRPNDKRPFRSGPSIGAFPLPACAGLAGIVVLGAFVDRTALAVGAVTIAAGLACSFVLVRDGRGSDRRG